MLLQCPAYCQGRFAGRWTVAARLAAGASTSINICPLLEAEITELQLNSAVFS